MPEKIKVELQKEIKRRLTPQTLKIMAAIEI